MQRDDPEDDQGDARRPEGRQALVEEEQRQDRDERDAEPPGDGIDEGEFPRPVGPAEGVEIECVENRGREDEGDRSRGQPLAAQAPEGRRDAEDRGHGDRGPEKRQRVAPPLDQGIPRGVDDGSRHHQEQRGRDHLSRP
jgi:hypothetical protein